MKPLALILSFAFFILHCHLLYPGATKTVDLNELGNPVFMIAGDNLLLISDNYTLKMFSIKNFKLIKTIGRKGEGPKEFRSEPHPQILRNSIMISSLGKLSYYDFSGNFIEEHKTMVKGSIIRKIGNNYVNFRPMRENDDFYLTYNLIAPDGSPIKVLYKGKWLLHKDRKRDLFEIFFLETYRDKIVFAHRSGFQIDVLDAQGNLLHSIKENPPRLPFTSKDRARIFKEMEDGLKDKTSFNAMKKRIITPDYFPPIRTCTVADDKIYVITYHKKNGLSECLVYGLEGKRIKRMFIPLKDASAMIRQYAIKGGKLYQLVENIEKEVWQIVVEGID